MNVLCFLNFTAKNHKVVVKLDVIGKNCGYFSQFRTREIRTAIQMKRIHNPVIICRPVILSKIEMI